MIVQGKPDNVYYLLSQMVEEGKDPSVVILDVPRDSENYLQYLTVEILKDGLVNSGKYKSIISVIRIFYLNIREMFILFK